MKRYLLVPLLLVSSSCIKRYQHPPAAPLLNPQGTQQNESQHRSPVSPNRVIVEASSDPSGGARLNLSRQELCSSTVPPSSWQFTATSLAQMTTITITALSAADTTAQVVVDGQSFAVALPRDFAWLRTTLCAAPAAGGPAAWFDDKTLTASLGTWLATLAPDCAWQWEQQRGFVCRLEEFPRGEAHPQLATLKKSLLAQSARPPYLLLRRLSMLEQISEITEEVPSNRAQASKQFCKGLEQSLGEEQPLVMSSPAWQRAFCGKDGWLLQDQAYGVGLTYGLRELASLQRIAAQITRKGHLLIKIPEERFTEKELWLNLEPQADVLQKVWQTALQIGEFYSGNAIAEKSLAQFFSDHRRTWHPLFADAGYQRALVLGLIEAPAVTTVPTPAPASTQQLKDEVTNYLSNSLLGETNFSLTNGYVKVLHLPLGHYRYTLYDLPAEDSNWAPMRAQKTSHGSLTWLAPSPRPLIASFADQPSDPHHLVEIPSAGHP